jgi:hypothetical protein
LSKLVSEANLPSLYGGTADAEATVFYADKGPWRADENKINYTDDGEEFKFEGEDDGSDVDNDQINDLKSALLKSK